MEDIAPRELESLNFSETSGTSDQQADRIMQNNENERVEEKKQMSPTPSQPQHKTPQRSGIRPPTAILRQPKPIPASLPR